MQKMDMLRVDNKEIEILDIEALQSMANLSR
jgi:hypothetical protein